MFYINNNKITGGKFNLREYLDAFSQFFAKKDKFWQRKTKFFSGLEDTKLDSLHEGSW
jgi:hypothetical protein